MRDSTRLSYFFFVFMNHTDLKTHIDCRFASLGNPERIFAVPSIHGDLARLNAVHEAIWQDYRAGDRIIYLGNYTGYGPCSRQTVDALLTFRRCLLSIPGVQPNDIVYLRGTQEEMWQKLMQLQFAPNPSLVLEWMLDKGLAQTMESYGIDIAEAQRITREGVIRLARWTERARYNVYSHAGHDIFTSQFKRAAYTQAQMKGTNSPLLFVNAGLDSSRPLEDQGDCFWWGHAHFKHMKSRYSPYQTVFRGFDPEQNGVMINEINATLDNNCGRGGTLVYAKIAGSGEILSLAEI